MKLTEFGAPESPRMPCYKDERLCASPVRVKDHPIWSQEDKPWAAYPHQSSKMHSSIECHFMYRLAKEMGSGDYANLGVFKGLSTACMAYGLRDGGHTGTIYSVDLFNHWNPEVPGEQLALFREGIESVGLTQYVKTCEGYTYEWAKKLADKKFKVILIDADHHYETCKDDFDRWSPLLAPDGLIMFHDVDMVTVDMVIAQMGSGWKEAHHIHRLKAFKRR